MAHLETRFRCSCCNCVVLSIADARSHVMKHIQQEVWAVSDIFPGKAEKIKYKEDIGSALVRVDQPDRYMDGTEEKPYELRLLKFD